MNVQALSDLSFHVSQGEFRVAGGHDAMLTTILGSCVAACIWDPDLGIGGMNHIVLPDAPESDLRRASAGANAMELLINGIIRQGGVRGRFQAKLFGGASMIEGLGNVGARNAAFARGFLEREGIPRLSESLGGSSGRRVQFWPATGRVRQRLMPTESLPDVAIRPPQPPPAANDLELF